MSPASLGKPNSQTLDWLDRSLARSKTVGHARKQKPTGNSKLCFKSLQGPSTTLLLRVNMRGDGLYCLPQAKQWVLVSDCADQTLPSQINKSYCKISHWLKVCISSGVAALSTFRGIWVGEEQLLVKKVKIQSLQAASSPLHLALAKTSWHWC